MPQKSQTTDYRRLREWAGEFFERCVPHADLMIRHYLPIGEGKSRILCLPSVWFKAGQKKAPVTGDGGYASCRGYLPYIDDKAKGWYEAHGEKYHEHIDRIKERRIDYTEAELHLESGFSEFLEYLKAHDVKPVFFVPPTILETGFAYALKEENQIEHLLVFNDPAQFAHYYQPENRFNGGHLNNETSAFFSRQLARRFHSGVLSSEGWASGSADRRAAIQ